MGTKLYIQQVKPVVELEVKVEGQDPILVGFKAHSIKDKEVLAKVWAEFMEVNKEAYTALVKVQDMEALSGLSQEEQSNITVSAFEFIAKQEELTLETLIEDILYIKNVSVTTYVDYEVLTSFKLPDTRKAEVIEGLWATPEEAQQVLLESFLDNKEWQTALLEAHKSSLDSSYKAEQRKN